MPGPSDRGRPPVLIVGVGSELRSDDAAGPRLAERLVGQLPDGTAEVLVVHQLTPELADAMTGRRLVVVVDASVEVTEVTASHVVTEGPDPDRHTADPHGSGRAGTAIGAMSHHLDLAALVGISRLLGEPPAQVLAVAVPAFDLTLGTGLSPGTAAAVSDAVTRILAWCRDVHASGGRARSSEGPQGSFGTGSPGWRPLSVLDGSEDDDRDLAPRRA